MKNPILFVSLGPGDPEMMTLKACRALSQADVILLPATRRPDGSLASRACEVVSQVLALSGPARPDTLDSPDIPDNSERPDIPENPDIPDPPQTPEIRLYGLPMKADRSEARAVYDQMKGDALRWQGEGRRVAIGVEGDISIYASVHYLLDSLADEGTSVEQVAGIPSFIASAAAARLSLISGSERLLVLPGNLDEGEAARLLASRHVLVVMKLSQCEAEVKAFMRANPGREYHYFENTGTPAACYLTRVEAMMERRFPYFSQLIIK